MSIPLKIKPRTICYSCYRPATSCMCAYISTLSTQTKFIILMHPKEFRKTKNGTGHFTHKSLLNSKLFVGIDFTHHKEINALLENPHNHCYVLYPSDTSVVLNQQSMLKKDKTNIIFLIDATWPCSKAMLKVSHNINILPKISFEHTKQSAYQFKEQPKEYCLSTIESTHTLLEILNTLHIESLDQEQLENFLDSFKQMVKYQVSCHQ